MKVSVLIIAHNEEKYIEKCINSILNQTKQPDEIILIAHNCTDKTIEIARKYPINLIPFNGENGIIYARIEGLEHVSGDIILCIDGDSYAEKNWVEEMVSLFKENVVLVGSWVKLSGSIFNTISNFFDKRACTKHDNATRWIWSASFGFLGKHKHLVKNVFERSIEFSKDLKLSRNPEDYLLALFMKRYGVLKVTNKTHVTANIKERGLFNEIKRNLENINNGNKIRRFLTKSINAKKL